MNLRFVIHCFINKINLMVKNLFYYKGEYLKKKRLNFKRNPYFKN